MADLNNNEKIKAILAGLDPLDDDQWTADGAPKVETVAALLGDKVTRQDIVNAEPDFNREKAGKPKDETEGNQQNDGQQNQNDGSQQNAGDGAQQNQNDGGAGAQSQKDPNETVEQTDNDQDGEADQAYRSDLDVDPNKFDQAQFSAWLQGQDKEDLEDIGQSIRDALTENSRQQDQLKEQASALKTASAQVKLRIRAEYPNTSDAQATRDYITAQTEARAARIGIRNSVLKGLKPGELDGRSALDAAMARKTTRGNQRPSRPLVR